MLGRLDSILAKELLNGQKVVVVRCEEICMWGGLVRQKMKHMRFLRKRMNTKPSHGLILFPAPANILWRTIRGEEVKEGRMSVLEVIIVGLREKLMADKVYESYGAKAMHLASAYMKVAAFAGLKLKAYEGIPGPYDKTKRMVIRDALMFCGSWTWFGALGTTDEEVYEDIKRVILLVWQF
ncbi:hypothetical protein PVK06_009922 [Gossypium arboreum]|uniref:Uncharacterized protein n=2 Tax=Gossypium TaxID=3633 RepID=A0ABR0QNY1_GOSAR|nr:hypothetical protein PVK06_009922 [Gossypium arboreum]